MFGRLQGWAGRNPTLATGLFVTFVLLLIGWIVAHAALGVIVDSQRESCKRGNIARLSELRQTTQEVVRDTAMAAVSKEQHPGQAWVWERDLEAAERRARQLKESVADYATAPDAVTVECDSVNPNPLSLSP